MEHQRPYIGVHVILKRASKLLLLRRHNTGYEDGNYTIVAGHADNDESATEAAIREAREEVGVEIYPRDLVFVGTMHRIKGPRIAVEFFFVSENWKGIPRNCESQKCDHVGWFDERDLPPNMVDYIARVFQRADRGVFFDEYGWQEAERQSIQRSAIG